MTKHPTPSRPAGPPVGAIAIFLEFLRLGLTSFGGPVAHIGYFRQAFVHRLGWIGEAAFADLVALCQFLPGPASSQLGMAIGLEKAGIGGSLAAFLGFTLPSAILMTALGLGLASLGGVDRGVLTGLGLVAVAVVAEAVRGMAVSLARGRLRAAIALLAATMALALPGAGLVQIAILGAGALAGLLFAPDDASPPPPAAAHPLSRRAGATALSLFALLLVALPALAATLASPTLSLIAAFYRSGSLVFGGGHVVLPLLEQATVAPGWISEASFVAGYGAAQAMPGPLFSVAAFLGAVAGHPDPIVGAALATLALFAPGYLLIVGALPFWRHLRTVRPVRRALSGVNSAVVGLLGAALYDPVFTTAVHGPRDLAGALLAYALLTAGRLPPWSVVLLAALAGWWLG